MLMTRQELIALIGPTFSAELDEWILRGWVRPDVTVGTEPRFAEIDVARVRLLCELRQEYEVTEGAMPIVVSLLDQVHGLRRALKAITEAVHELPPEMREQVRARVGSADLPEA